MLWKLKRMGSYMIILLLLPYVITIFLNGPSQETSAEVKNVTVTVEQNGEEIAMSLDDYGIGKLASEIPATYKEEALKAQAIVVRTTIYGQILESGSDTVFSDDFFSSKEMEKNWGEKYRANYRKIKKAWDETEGQVLIYNEKPAYVPFCRLTNGSTRDGKEVLGSEEYPYLKMRECPFDIESKEQIQTKTIDDMDAEVTETDSAGYVKTVRVGENQMSAEEFRTEYELDSSCFTLQHYDGNLRIVTRGVGHGLGMSQYTANRMAGNGGSFEDILKYFFEGTEIREVADIVKK